jgi:hypothetical protein
MREIKNQIIFLPFLEDNIIYISYRGLCDLLLRDNGNARDKDEKTLTLQRHYVEKRPCCL